MTIIGGKAPNRHLIKMLAIVTVSLPVLEPLMRRELIRDQ